eukprot:Colp12_sorted_trinity150504_noHs@27743
MVVVEDDDAKGDLIMEHLKKMELHGGNGVGKVIVKEHIIEKVVHHSPAMARAKSPVRPVRRPVQVGISFDTTGSMFCYLEAVRHNVKELCTELFNQIDNVEVSLLAHGDYCDREDSYVDRYIPFVKDPQVVRKFLETVGATGGGLGDACYELVLRRYNKDLKWDYNSLTRSLVIIGDTNPHEKGYTYKDFTLNFDWREELAKLKKLRVTIYAIQCGNVHSATKFFKTLADETGGAHLQLGNSSPDDIVDAITAACLKQAGQLEKLAQLRLKAESSNKAHLVQVIRIIEKVHVHEIAM